MSAVTGRTLRALCRSLGAGLLALVALGACTREPQGPSPAAAPRPGLEVEAARQGWMGRYSRGDPQVTGLLEAHPGWRYFRDMDLFEAVQAFSGESDRGVGLARTYLAFADLYGSLDELFLEAEERFLAPARPSSGALWARKGWVALRLEDLATARDVFGPGAPLVPGYPGALGRAGLAYLEGRTDQVKKLASSGPLPETEDEKVLGLVACYLWGVPCPTGDRSPYGQALDAFRTGDLASGVLALQMIDFTAVGEGPGPDLYLYLLLERGFAGLAASAADGARATFWAARARDVFWALQEALPRYARAEEGQAGTGLEPWIFSPVLGPDEAALLGRVYRGSVLYRLGRKADAAACWRRAIASPPGPLVLATLAQVQSGLETSGPLGDPVHAALSAVEEARRALDAMPGGPGDAMLPELYAVRVAEVARRAARVLWHQGRDREALDLLEGAYRKTRGYEADFVNPPGFLVDLARGYARAGRHGAAMQVLLEVTRSYPSARIGYESLKRLRGPGDAPARR